MSRFRSEVQLPPNLSELFDAVNGCASLESIDWHRGLMVIEFEEDDAYDLALTVRNLQEEINSLLGYMAVSIPKPVPTEDTCACKGELHDECKDTCECPNCPYPERCKEPR